jgi:hypothetical protein
MAGAQLMRSGAEGMMGAEGLRAVGGLLRNLSSSLMPDALLLGGPGGRLLRPASLGPRWSAAASHADADEAVSAPQTARAWRPGDPSQPFKAQPEPCAPSLFPLPHSACQLPCSACMLACKPGMTKVLPLVACVKQHSLPILLLPHSAHGQKIRKNYCCQECQLGRGVRLSMHEAVAHGVCGRLGRLCIFPRRLRMEP